MQADNFELGLLCAGVGIPIVTPAVADKSAAHLFECFYKIAPLHLRDQEFFDLANIGHFARFDVF